MAVATRSGASAGFGRTRWGRDRRAAATDAVEAVRLGYRRGPGIHRISTRWCRKDGSCLNLNVKMCRRETLGEFTLSLRIFALHITHRRGSSLCETAICMVLTKHFLQTTWCPHGAVCIVALAWMQMTHCNKTCLYLMHFEFEYCALEMAAAGFLWILSVN